MSKKDRNYQNIINRYGIKNQDNVGSRKNFQRNDNFPGNIARPGRFATRRNGKNLSLVSDAQTTSLSNELTDNIFEIITIPYPTFMTVSYEIVFWTQYVQNMNKMIEVMMSKFTGQETGFHMKTDKGYEYVAYVKSPLNAADNFNDFSKDERIIRYNFTLEVPGYLVAPNADGLPTPFRKYESAPQIEFGYTQDDGFVFTDPKNPEDVVDQDKFVLSEIESESMKSLKRGETSAKVAETIINPFTGEESLKVAKIKTRNERAGETVASSRIGIELQTTLDSPTSE